MRIYKLPSSKEITEDEKRRLQEFSYRLIDLCNEYRVAAVLGNILFLKNEPVEGKLLDVAGFKYDPESNLTYPFFVDRLSGNENEEK